MSIATSELRLADRIWLAVALLHSSSHKWWLSQKLKYGRNSLNQSLVMEQIPPPSMHI